MVEKKEDSKFKKVLEIVAEIVVSIITILFFIVIGIHLVMTNISHVFGR